MAAAPQDPALHCCRRGAGRLPSRLKSPEVGRSGMVLKGWAHVKVPRHGLNLPKSSDSSAFPISLPGCAADKGEGRISLESCCQSDIKRWHHPLSQLRGCRFLDMGRVMTDKAKRSLGGYHTLHTHTIYTRLTECCNNQLASVFGFSLRKKLGGFVKLIIWKFKAGT